MIAKFLALNYRVWKFKLHQKIACDILIIIFSQFYSLVQLQVQLFLELRAKFTQRIRLIVSAIMKTKTTLVESTTNAQFKQHSNLVLTSKLNAYSHRIRMLPNFIATISTGETMLPSVLKFLESPVSKIRKYYNRILFLILNIRNHRIIAANCRTASPVKFKIDTTLTLIYKQLFNLATERIKVLKFDTWFTKLIYPSINVNSITEIFFSCMRLFDKFKKKYYDATCIKII